MSGRVRQIRYWSWLVFVCTGAIAITSPLSEDFRFDDFTYPVIVGISGVALVVCLTAHAVYRRQSERPMDGPVARRKTRAGE